MELRKDLETLIVWYVPIAIVTFIISGILSGYFYSITGDTVTLGTKVSFVAWANQIFSYADNLVVGIWLFNIRRRANDRPFIWAAFGLITHFFAVTIYICTLIYEQKSSHQNNN